ncbi:MAG: XkdF-like putative serine protease domain-containing protein [Rhodothermales bacterium]
MPRQLSNLHVTFLSLVDKGANQKQIVWKAETPAETEPQFRRIVDVIKFDEDEQLVYGVVYEPDVLDAHGDTATAAEIKKAAHLFLKEARTASVDKQHDLDPQQGYIAESWIVRAQDPNLPETKAGAWAVAIKVENAETWALVKSGDITGISLYGYAEVEDLDEVTKSETPKSDAPVRAEPGSFWSRLKKRLSPSKPVAKDFLGEQRASALWRATDDLYWANEEALWSTSPLAQLRTNTQQFLSYLDTLETLMKDATDLDDLKTRLEALEKAASGDPEEPAPTTADLLARLEALEKAGNAPEEPEATEEPEGDTVADLTKRLEALEKRSNGRQSHQTQDGQEPVQKGFTGIRFV